VKSLTPVPETNQY